MSTTVVYGANCVWWDSIDMASTKPSGLPCCPHCGSVLFQNDAESWARNVRAHEAKGNPGYEAFITWLRGRCFRTIPEARRAYDENGAGT